MSLVEISLTLCLLVVLASLTWPALGRPMATHRLRVSADQVRTEWVHARVEAMSSGQPHAFRYTLDGDSYLLEEQANEDDASASPTDDAGQDSGDADNSRSLNRRLPDKVRFVTAQTAGQSGTQTAASPGVEPAAAAGDSGLSQPIFFYADGTSSDAQVSLRNEYGQTIALSLRGLTGVVLVSEVRSAEASGQ
jgi:Tfp pilus assembly protein FimT